ncbi:MAG: DUF4258 domain-containing protein [Candidatus Aenigmarchaeota archaeon]|nr:DUF4258 domain-containing protein [Candidatus Aenigmarchaeota archaeon]
MKIVYTNHAEIRSLQRGIKKELIEEVIKNPDMILDLDYERKQAIKKINKDKISVIYVKEGNNITVITVHWGE